MRLSLGRLAIVSSAVNMLDIKLIIIIIFLMIYFIKPESGDTGGSHKTCQEHTVHATLSHNQKNK